MISLRQPWVRIVLVVAAAILLFALFAASTWSSITHQAFLDESRAADVIVVFGAAEYAGRPSPVYRARLDHGYILFGRGLAPLIITTGGFAGSEFSEGGVGRDYLLKRGVPDEQIIAETQSESTVASARRVANIMRTNGMKTCLAVSDPYHVYRIKRMLEREGVTVYTSPRPELKPLTFRQRADYIWHEILSYTLWKLRIT